MARTAASVAERNNAGQKTAKKVPKTYAPARKVIITVPSRKKIDFIKPSLKEKALKRVVEQWNTLIKNSATS